MQEKASDLEDRTFEVIQSEDQNEKQIEWKKVKKAYRTYETQ